MTIFVAAVIVIFAVAAWVHSSPWFVYLWSSEGSRLAIWSFAGFSTLITIAGAFIVDGMRTHTTRKLAETTSFPLKEAPYDKDDLGRRDETQDLIQERNQLLSVLASMVDGVLAIDVAEKLIQVNPMAAKMLGLDTPYALGREIAQTIRVPAILDAVEDAFRDHVAVTRDFELDHPSNTISIQLSVTPYLDDGGELLGAAVVLHDMTELRRLEVVRRDFVTNVSHELKTPLTAIRGFVETLVDDPEMDIETRKRFLDRVHEQSKRLSALVTDLLVLSKFESEKHPYDSAPLDLRNAIQEVDRLLRGEAEDKGLSLEVSLPTEPVLVAAERESLHQLFNNLVANAIKYTVSGSVSVRVTILSGAAIVDVIDTGPGIEKRHLVRIFERFYRVDRARSRELGGTGLGLAIVKHIALSLGGNVSVTSTPGEGTTFRVRLPINHSEAGQSFMT